MCESDCRGCREGCGNTVPTITDDQLAEIEASRDMHGKIMNIGHGQKSPIMTAGEWLAYRSGHRDARHAAAEIALAGDAEIERLRAMIKAANAKLAEVMRERDAYKLNSARYEYVRNNCDVVMPDGMYVEDSSDIDKAMGGAK